MYTATLHCIVSVCCFVQYFFGEDILVGPITGPVDNVTLLAKKEIWIPEVGKLNNMLTISPTHHVYLLSGCVYFVG